MDEIYLAEFWAILEKSSRVTFHLDGSVHWKVHLDCVLSWPSPGSGHIFPTLNCRPAAGRLCDDASKGLERKRLPGEGGCSK